jgi:two-component system NtrC family response regulator
MAEILIIDDDEIMSYTLSRMTQHLGHKATIASSLQEGLDIASRKKIDVVFLDVRLPDGNGLEIIPELRATASSPEIIIITAFSNSSGAELALKSGVWDYIEKPSKVNDMKLPLVRALEYRKQKQRALMHFSVDRCGIVGSSTQTTYCVDLMANAATCDANVLIYGETGTGKELFARAIHLNSPRCAGVFMVVDCAALPEHLVESILFGHVKGAYTGADQDSEGLIRQADGGTLFLDEVGELPANLQKTFLRVLQERCFRPVGSKKEINSNFRLVAATNRNLDEMCKKGLFRNDLLHRLRTLSIELPPLREKRGDIKEIAYHYIDKLCDKYDLKPKSVAPEFLNTLIKYNWTGNVRELVNVLESSVNSAAHEPILFPVHIPHRIRAEVTIGSMRDNSLKADDSKPDAQFRKKLPLLRNLLNETKREYMLDLMNVTGGNLDKAIKISGLSKASLYNYFKKFNISAANGR